MLSSSLEIYRSQLLMVVYRAWTPCRQFVLFSLMPTIMLRNLQPVHTLWKSQRWVKVYFQENKILFFFILGFLSDVDWTQHSVFEFHFLILVLNFGIKHRRITNNRSKWSMESYVNNWCYLHIGICQQDVTIQLTVHVFGFVKISTNAWIEILVKWGTFELLFWYM